MWGTDREMPGEMGRIWNTAVDGSPKEILTQGWWSSAGTCLRPSAGAPRAWGAAEKQACPAAWGCCPPRISQVFQSCSTKVCLQQFQDVAQEHTGSTWQEYHCMQICFGMQVKVGVITFMNH